MDTGTQYCYSRQKAKIVCNPCVDKNLQATE